ncbi:MAG: hypothetical protein LBU82_05660 [Treponema sp.]|nr:hypothetical protein [Treponema sp.]
MDVAIRKAEERLQAVTRNKEDRWFYEIREKALSDWTSGVNHARREGIKEGRDTRNIEIARNALMNSFSIDQIRIITWLDEETIKRIAASSK